ncbi:MAG: hypothetical protein ACK4RK_15625 [Gemmataceae bacterium]
MMSKTQIIVSLVVLLGVIAGVSFISQFTGTMTLDPTGTLAPAPGSAGLMLALVDPAHALPEASPRVLEKDALSCYEVWFQNPAPFPLEITWKGNSANCQGVDVGVVSSSATDRYVRLAALCLGSPGTGATMWSGPWSALAVAQWRHDWQWTELRPTTPRRVVIPAADAGHGPAWGILRFQVRSHEEGEEPLTGDWLTRALPDGTPRAQHFQTRVRFVPSLRVFPEERTFTDWRTDQPPPSVEFWVWSATRCRFTLVPRAAAPDPWWQTTVQPLTRDECRDLAQQLALAFGPTSVTSAYRVVARGRDVDKAGQLPDWGKMTRHLVLDSDASSEPVRIVWTGRVVGPVQLGRGSDGDGIDLGNFPLATGTRHTIQLSTEQRDVTMRVERVHPAYLQVQLLEMPMQHGRSHWQLQVAIPPDRVSGPLPDDSAVYLSLSDLSQRLLRIPVSGVGYR